jgi:hypothetical protein
VPTSFTALESGASGVLYVADGQTSPTWVGYYLPLAAAGGSPPSTLTLDASWGYWGNPMQRVNGGCYVFFPAQPPAGTADALDALLTDPTTGLNARYQGTAYRYVLWIPAVAQPLAVVGAIPFGQQSGITGTVTQAATVALRTLQLTLDVGITLAPGDDDASLVAGIAGTARLKLNQTRGTPSGVGNVTTGGSIALAGANAGGVAFDMTLSVFSQQVSDLATLVVGVKYFYAEPAHAGNAAVVKSQLCPILGVPSGDTTIPFSVSLDPLHATDATRTLLTFQGGSAFSTSLRTTTGIPLTLDPVVGSAGLGLAPDKVTPLGGGTQKDSYYAVLSGAFTIGPGAPVPAGPLPLLCGMSGLEAVTVTPAVEQGYAGDTLHFLVGQPAFAPAFPPAAVSLDDPSKAGLGQPKLGATMTTAWASVTPAAGGSAPQYHAQPHGAPLFGGGASTLGLLPLVDHAVSGAAASFPLAAYGGTTLGPGPDGFDPALLPAFEQAVLSPTRRAFLTLATRAVRPARVAGDGDGNGQKATSPQGFLVTLGADTSWASLLLAQTVDQGVTHTLEYAPVDPRVQAAFQTNQLSLVATQAAWDASSFQSSIAIEGWPFEVAVGKRQTFGSYSNVLIAKFCHGKLADLIKDPKRWTDAGVFNATANNELLAVSEWLQSYFDAAAGSKDPAFANFNAIAVDDAWQGILVLRVDVPLDQLPAQVGALRAGLSQSSFYAHHLGIEVSKVDETLSVSGSSSLFGLIDYLDPVYEQAIATGGDANTPVPPEPGVTYDFKVLRLLVLFENSEVKDFQSKSQVTVNQWFGDKVVNTRMAGGGTVTNSIVIDGALQRHDGQPVYLFTSAVDTVFELDSNVLESVEVLSTSLTTIVDSPNGLSTFRFAFTGYLSFAALPGLDAFSFAPPGDQSSGGGLAYADLFLDMGFQLFASPPRTFTFTPDRIAFNVGLSSARTGSLYAALPLTLKGLVSGAKGGLSQQGFLPVSLPGVKLSSLPDQWYGLMFDFDLGTPGALAAEAGWTAGLVVAWGAGSASDAKTARAAAGMQLPGAGGQSKLLGLQGVLKLTIGEIELSCVAGGAYLLRLTQIALHFLSLQFPPSGSTAFYLFGDPAAKPGQRSQTAWYAAYAKPVKPTKELLP